MRMFAAPILVTLVAGLASLGGCAVPPKSTPIDADVDFAAHPGYRGLVVDRMNGGRGGVLVRTHAAPAASPSHLLRTDGNTIAAFWVTDHDHITVRQAPDAAAPSVGEVQALWKHGAMHLTFHLADGTWFRTSPFDRVDSRNFPNVLDRQMFSVSDDLPGIYRAQLFDAQDASVGWLRVRILPYQGLPRDYEGDVPASLNGPLAAGAVALVDAEIDALIERNAFPEDRMPEGLAP